MYNDSSSPTLTNVTFSSNYAAYYGGGMYNESSSPTLTNVTFSSNSTTYNGGGGLVNLSSSPTLTNVTFSSNSAGAGGGGMYNNSSSPTLTNVTFSSNSAGTIGGGMFNLFSSSPTLTNVTFSSNSAGYGAGMYNESSSPTLTNSILWGDSGVEIINDFSSVTVSYSDVQGGWSGTGNINADPLFVDAAHGDLHLRPGSPAIDTGTNTGAPRFDRDNNPRPIDGGSGQAITDMGAYEFRPILYVNAAAAAGGNGTSWATAYTDLQQALAAAQATEAIWVAQGTYKPTSGTDRTISFALKDGVEVYGGFAGTETQLGQRDWVQHVTTLSGDIGKPDDSSDNSYQVVTSSGLDASAILDGFTITAGNANKSFTILTRSGGGMYNDSSSPTLTNLIFSSNHALNDGGGMYNDSSSPTLTNVTFSSNSATDGGGMFNYFFSSPTLTNVTFYSNSATWGGGMYNVSIERRSSPRLTNVTFSSNRAEYGGGMYNKVSSSPTLTNSILWGDSGGEIYNEDSSSATVSYSDVQGGWSGTGIIDAGKNINADPLFVDAAQGDLHLRQGSPAIDTGTNTGAPLFDRDNNPRPVDGGTGRGAFTDMGAYQYRPILYVNAAAGPGGDGTNWATAYTDLQQALAAAQATEAIWVAQGTYKPTSGTDRTISFALKAGVEVYGGFAGTETQLGQRDWVQHVTTLSGDIGVPGDNSDNSNNVVFSSGLDASAILDGFTITAGNANGNGFLERAEAGGGMYNYSSSPTLTNLIFSRNSAGEGGGLFNINYNVDYTSSPTVTNVTFDSNSAEFGGGGMYNYGSSPTLTNVTFGSNHAGNSSAGGGLFNVYSSPTLTNVTFDSNSANEGGGGMYNVDGSPTLTNVTFSRNSSKSTSLHGGGGMFNYASSPYWMANSPRLTNVTFSGNSADEGGGGMYNESSSPTLTNVTFDSNSAGTIGGGLFNTNSSSPTLTNVTFSSNSATGGGGGLVNYTSSPTLTNVSFSSNSTSLYGGGMENFSSSPTLTNVTFSSNSADGGGGMANAYGSSPTLTNVSFSSNSASLYGGGMENFSSSPTLTNCILWGDSGGEIYNDDSSSVTVSYSDVQGGWSGTGIIDAGNNINADPLFVDGIHDLHLRHGSPAIDTGTNKFLSPQGTNLVPSIDLDGNPRPVDGGTGRGAITDMGAYEFRPILYVNAAAAAGGDGTSWATAYTDLQQALAAAQATETIWVAQGTYKPTSGTDRTISFTLKGGVAVYGGFAGTETQLGQRDWVQHVTTLSGDIGVPVDSSDNSYQVVTSSGLDASAILDGFTITAGNANGGFYLQDFDDGGGMYNYGSDPTLTNLSFTRNSAHSYGGGMYNNSSWPTLTNVTFSSNSAYVGGGMFNFVYSSPTLTNVTFSSNSATEGGGMYNSHFSSPTLTNVTFSSNYATNVGGGMSNVFSSPTLTDCILWGDSGGEIFNDSSSVTVSYSDVQGGWSGTGIIDAGNNINADPRFVDAAHGDLHLRRDSPAIDTGTNTGAPRFDRDNSPRPIDGGSGQAITDMGAYEFRPIIYVNAAAAAGGNGTSWATAYTDLQQALAAAQVTEAIWVAQGTYKPTSGTDRTISFALKGGVAVYGGFAGTETGLGQRDWVQHVTTLSGDIGVPDDSSDNSNNVVTSSGLDASAILDGFTITAGNAYKSLAPNLPSSSGGGMYNYASSPTLTNLTFSRNSATDSGGGLFNYGSSPTLTNVTFYKNSATEGGGLFNDFCSPTLTNVTFSSNSATDGGGGGMYNYSQFADADQRHLQHQLQPPTYGGGHAQLLQFADGGQLTGADQRHLQQQLRRLQRRRHGQHQLQFADADQRHLQHQLRRRRRRRHAQHRLLADADQRHLQQQLRRRRRRRHGQLLQFADADQRHLQQQLHLLLRRRHVQLLLQFADADQRHLQQQLRHRRRRRPGQLLQFADADQRHLQQQLHRRRRRRHGKLLRFADADELHPVGRQRRGDLQRLRQQRHSQLQRRAGGLERLRDHRRWQQHQRRPALRGRHPRPAPPPWLAGHRHWHQ